MNRINGQPRGQHCINGQPRGQLFKSRWPPGYPKQSTQKVEDKQKCRQFTQKVEDKWKSGQTMLIMAISASYLSAKVNTDMKVLLSVLY